MARANMSIPHERRKAKLRSKQIALRVKKAEVQEALKNTSAELQAMRPKPKPTED